MNEFSCFGLYIVWLMNFFYLTFWELNWISLWVGSGLFTLALGLVENTDASSFYILRARSLKHSQSDCISFLPQGEVAVEPSSEAGWGQRFKLPAWRHANPKPLPNDLPSLWLVLTYGGVCSFHLSRISNALIFLFLTNPTFVVLVLLLFSLTTITSIIPVPHLGEMLFRSHTSVLFQFS